MGRAAPAAAAAPAAHRWRRSRPPAAFLLPLLLLLLPLQRASGFGPLLLLRRPPALARRTTHAAGAAGAPAAAVSGVAVGGGSISSSRFGVAAAAAGFQPPSPKQQQQQWRRRRQQQLLAAAAGVEGAEGGEKKPSFLKVLWRFTRPHTFIGTALCIPALTLYAAPPRAPILTPQVLGAILWALLPAGLINVYITGLNQVTDVEIDRINKPYLPIAAGQLSQAAASVVVVASLLVGLGLGLLPSPFGSQALLWVLVSSALLGTAYSLPPLRLKRFPVLAALCIIAVRGTVINLGFYGHALAAAFASSPASPALSFTQALSPLFKDAKCMAATTFFAVFGAVIALMKDVPDIKGDRLNNIRSFSVRAGAARIFKLGKRLMIALFLSAAALCLAAARHAFTTAGGLTALRSLSLSSPFPALWPFFTAAARAVIAVLALRSAKEVQARAGAVDPQDGKQVYDYYMYLWRLFYLSYLALPLAR